MKILPRAVLIQFLIPHHWITRLVHAFMTTRRVWLKNFIIQKYVAHYRVDLNEARHPRAEDYANFNDFFTRELKPGARNIPQNPNRWIAPVDGQLSQFGEIKNDTLIQAKGKIIPCLLCWDTNSRWFDLFQTEVS